MQYFYCEKENFKMGRVFEVCKVVMVKIVGVKIKVYFKYGKEIYVCVKNGGVDLDINLLFCCLMEKVKKDQVFSYVIDKVIDKVVGGVGEDFQFMCYEGFGLGNCMVIVDCLFDNVNCIIIDVCNCFIKINVKFGVQGVVFYMFDY